MLTSNRTITNTRIWLIRLALSLVVGILSGKEYCLAQPPRGEATPKVFEVPSLDFSWTKGPWKDDDKPFAAFRREINKLTGDGKLSDDMVAAYKRGAQGVHSTEPLSQFKWAYSSYCRQLMLHTPGQKRLSGTLEGLQRAKKADGTPQLSYTYCRQLYLQFLIGGNAFGPLRQAGERLLKINPHDYDVEFYQLGFLDRSVPGDLELYNKYMADMKRQHPSDPGLQEFIADSEYKHWFIISRKESDADRAIAAYESLLKMKGLPPDAAVYAHAQIAEIQRLKPKLKPRRRS